MNYKIILITAMKLVMLWEVSNAQSNRDLSSKKLSISAGSSVIARQDLIYSPFIHSDKSLNSYMLKYSNISTSVHIAEIRFSYNTIEQVKLKEITMVDHKHMSLPHEFLNFSAAYGFGKPINSSEKSDQWIGGAFKAEMQGTFYNFILSDMFGYYINFSLNAWYGFRYSFDSKHGLSGSAGIPVLSWLARPPYLAEDDSFIENISHHNKLKSIGGFIADGRIATFDQLQSINMNFEYSYRLTDRLTLGIDYHFSFIRTTLPRTLLSYHHNINFLTSISI